ncbi:MAG: hypothetical protein V5A39_09095 [Haloarculaceae archaeon]
MEKTDAGTTVGVDDPYDHVDRCDHLTDDGRCRYAVEHGDRDPQFASERRQEEYRCPVAGDPTEDGPTGPWTWQDCPHFRCRDRDRECARCGLAEVRLAHDDECPLLEEHHLSYADGGSDAASNDAGEDLPAHEITIYLCRWCHAKVHDSWARVDDDVSPDTDAIAERESRRAREQAELGFESAADRFDES